MDYGLAAYIVAVLLAATVLIRVVRGSQRRNINWGHWGQTRM